ncbi:hypothetical protein AX14_002174, partial [Amanita brunnescens Koide BX004]
SCPRGADEPASWTLTVEQFDEGTEEFFNRTFRACGACNRSCKRSFMGHKVKSRVFDNSTRASFEATPPTKVESKASNYNKTGPSTSPPSVPHRSVPGSASYAIEHPVNPATSPKTSTAPLPRTSPNADGGNSLHQDLPVLQDALRALNARPPTPAAFVATIRTASCCKCGKLWLPSDSVLPQTASIAQRFRGGVGSGTVSSPEPDIWTPSPRSSPDEIDDLTARAALPLPASRSESDASRAPSRASSVAEPINIAVTPLPTPDFSSLDDDAIDGLVHPSFPDRAILDMTDKRHFLGRGDLAVTSLKLYARRIFSETSHWITAGHFLVDIFQGSTLNGSRDDFRRFVILVGTQLGFGDLALSMSESLDANKKMADEYMRLRDVATTWKQKAKANSKDARNGRKAQDELDKAQGDIAAVLEEREIFIQQRRELLARDDQLSTELSRVHKDYGNAIEDNTRFAADIEALRQDLDNTRNLLSMAEHHRDKAEQDCGIAEHRLDKEIADHRRDKAFYEARILALSEQAVPTSQPDSETPLSAAAIDKSVLMTRVENLKKELSIRDTELAKLRSEVSLSPEVNTLRAELAEAKAVAARLSGMYEQKSKDVRDSELERLTLLGKQILADGAAPAPTPPARPRPASRQGRQRSRSSGRAEAATAPPAAMTPDEPKSISTPPSSQPFWQDEPLFTKHVAAVTTATMSALPHLPFETAIATAFTTVRKVGPPPPLKLDKKPGNRRSGAPSPPTPAPAPPQGGFTFADMVKATASKEDKDNTKRKPTWRAMETSKALVLRPSTKGTRVSELHLKIPKTPESADLFRLKGTALLERVAKLVSDHSEPAPRMALRDNPLVLVKWSMKGNLVLKCTKPMDDVIKDGIKDALTYFFPSPSAEILVLNKPPTTALKFLAVPRHNLDGTDTDEMDLLDDLTAHPAWADVELWANPKFINLRSGMAGATVVMSVVDDNQGNVGRRLMGTMVNFSGKERHVELYAEIEAKFPKSGAKNPQGGTTRKNAGPKKKVGFSKPDAEGFVQVGAPPGVVGIARIDAPLGGSIVGALADEALRPELKGNEEARLLMQETLLDEAAFAAADAQAPSGSSGSPPTSLSYA